MNSKNLKLRAIVLIVMSSLFSYAQKPVQLKVEYTLNPIGIDVSKPLFSWQIQTRPRIKEAQIDKQPIKFKYSMMQKGALVWDTDRGNFKIILWPLNMKGTKTYNQEPDICGTLQ
jgi:hypothetical protein